MVDAAIDKKVKWFIYSTLWDAEKLSQGRLMHVVHCTNKAHVEQYARDRVKNENIQTKISYVAAGNYYQNYPNLKLFKISDTDSNIVENQALSLKVDTKLPFTDVDEDFGKVVSAMFENIDKVKNRTISAVTPGFTLENLLSATADALGKKYKYNVIDDDTLEKYMGKEFREMYQLFNEYQDALNEINNENDPKPLVGNLKTPKEWVASYGVDYLKK
jgi:hypothetical protein